MNSNASRLRKTFQYPSDDTDNSPAEGIDEEEQSRMIAQLAARDARTNATYAPLLPFLPGLSLLLFLASAFFGSAALSRTNPVFYVMCLVSLLLSLALSYDVERPAAGDGGGASVSPLQAMVGARASPLAQHPTVGAAYENLTAIAGASCGVVVLLALLDTLLARDDAARSSVGMYAFPVIFVYIIVLAARRELRPLDTQKLEQLKYQYRGA